MLYISDKLQGVWMTKFCRMSVFYRALIHYKGDKNDFKN